MNNSFYKIKFFLKKGTGKIFLKNLTSKITYNYILMIFNILKYSLYNNNFFKYYNIYINIKPNIYKIKGLSFGLYFYLTFFFFLKKRRLSEFCFATGIISYSLKIIPVNNINYKLLFYRKKYLVCLISKKNKYIIDITKKLIIIKIDSLKEIK